MMKTDFPRHTMPLIGAEVMDTDVATPALADHWFGLLRAHNMPLARVFVPYREKDMEILDCFFEAASKHGVLMTVTLGGPPTEKNAQRIESIVRRYHQQPALDSWILMNEPGQAPEPNPIAIERFRPWLVKRYGSIDHLNDAWGTHHADFADIAMSHDPRSQGQFTQPAQFLDWHFFWMEHLAWHLEWIRDQVRLIDTVHPVHTNPHALAGNLACVSLNLPDWRRFLDSLGCSIHPSWHFPLLKRDQFTMGVSYVCDMVRGSIEPKPFWITELQGGNNTHSGNRPLYPWPSDLAQWLWTGIGAGTQRIIFWLLNNRTQGGESGEWSLLNFQNQPTERLQAAGQVAKVVSDHQSLFASATPLIPPVTLVVGLETMVLQERAEQMLAVDNREGGTSTRLEGRGRNAHVLAFYATYRALCEHGITPRVKYLHDLEPADAPIMSKPGVFVLPNVTCMSQAQAQHIIDLAQAGHTVLLTGMTGAWDHQARFTTLTDGFPFAKALGATLADIRMLETPSFLSLQEPKLELPTHLWVGEIANESAQVIGSQQGWITAVRNKVGRGQIIWIPSLIDVGAWLHDDEPWSKLLASVVQPWREQIPFSFQQRQPGCLLRVMQSGESYITVLANGTMQPAQVKLIHPASHKPTILWPVDAPPVTTTNPWLLPPRGTVVCHWQRV